MTVREQLRFYARAKGVATVDRDIELVIRKTGLQMYEDTTASKLSGGNKRKLSLAIALIGTSRVSCCGHAQNAVADEDRQPVDLAAGRTVVVA
jgi:ABC-type multidrug transport system ATPase subunit